MNLTPSCPPKLILASQSPRRRELLQKAGFDFEVVPSLVDENTCDQSAPESLVEQLALAKAQDIAGRFPDAVVLGADTVVVSEGSILGKPDGDRHARDMLEQLSGSWHQVLTGYAIVQGNLGITVRAAIVTEVKFKRLTTAEIEWYIKTAEPEDKAGAYAIQGIGALWVEKIRGSYTNVVGLPLCEVAQALMQLGIGHPTNTKKKVNRSC